MLSEREVLIGYVVFHGDDAIRKPVTVLLQWNADDPLAILAEFGVDGEAVVPWQFSRELMMQGVTSSAIVGDADIRFQVVGGSLQVCLRSPEGHAHIRLPLDRVVGFLERTADEVAVGSEDCGGNLDAVLTKILEGSA